MGDDVRETIWIVLGIAFVATLLTGLFVVPVLENSDLQRNYNRSVVQCVEAGGDPLHCRTALLPK